MGSHLQWLQSPPVNEKSHQSLPWEYFYVRKIFPTNALAPSGTKRCEQWPYVTDLKGDEAVWREGKAATVALKPSTVPGACKCLVNM